MGLDVLITGQYQYCLEGCWKRSARRAARALKSVFAREREMKIEPFFQPIYLDVKRKALVSTVGTQYRGCNKVYK